MGGNYATVSSREKGPNIHNAVTAIFDKGAECVRKSSVRRCKRSRAYQGIRPPPFHFPRILRPARLSRRGVIPGVRANYNQTIYEWRTYERIAPGARAVVYPIII